MHWIRLYCNSWTRTPTVDKETGHYYCHKNQRGVLHTITSIIVSSIRLFIMPYWLTCWWKPHWCAPQSKLHTSTEKKMASCAVAAKYSRIHCCLSPTGSVSVSWVGRNQEAHQGLCTWKKHSHPPLHQHGLSNSSPVQVAQSIHVSSVSAISFQSRFFVTQQVRAATLSPLTCMSPKLHLIVWHQIHPEVAPLQHVCKSRLRVSLNLSSPKKFCLHLLIPSKKRI